MPTYKGVSMRFIKDFLSNKKKLLRASEVVFLNVPLYDELSVKNIFS